MSTYILHGDEKYIIKKKKRSFIDQSTAMSLSRFDEFSEEAKMSCIARPFLCQKKFVVVEGLFKNVFTENLLKYLEREVSTTDLLVIVMDNIDKRSKVYKKVPQTMITEVAKLTPSKFESYVCSKMASKSLSNQMLHYLIELLDYNNNDAVTLFDVNNYLDVLLSYDGIITMEIVNHFLPPSVKNDAFKLVDALLHNDDATALKYIEEEKLNNSTQNTFYLFYSNVSLMLRYMLGADYKELGITYHRANHIKRSTENASISKLMLLMDTLEEIDMQFKNHTLGKDDLLDVLYIRQHQLV